MSLRALVVCSSLFIACAGDPDPQETEGGSTSTATDGVTASPSTTTMPGSSSGGSGSSSSSGGSSSEEGSSGSGSEDGSSGSSTGEMSSGSPGCRAAEQLAEGEHMFELDGYDRRYILRLPASYTTDRPWPLIFALHGNGGNPGYWDGIGGDRDIRTAFADEAIIIIPEAINNAWRDYDAPPETWPEFMELELSFFDTVYQEALDGLCIDPRNVFSMGFSGGGSFSGVLGCRRDYIRAIAVGGSVIYFEEADCTETPAAWITIGELEYNDGRAAFRDFFRDHAGCQETSMPGMPDGCVEYDGCGSDTPITYCSHPADHVWPSIGTEATKTFFQQFYLR